MAWPFARTRALMRAKRFYKQHNVHAAMEIYVELLTNNAADARALVGLGHCYVRLEKYVSAAKCLEKAKQVPSEDDEFSIFDHLYHYSLAEVYDKLGRSAECVAHYESGLRLEHVPSDRTVSYPHLFYRLARHCKDVGAYEKAVTYFRKVQKPAVLGLSEADLLCELEEVLMKLGRIDEANECMRRAAKLPVQRAANQAHLAWFHFNERMNESDGERPGTELVKSTVEAIKAAIMKERDNYKFWYQLGYVLYRSELYEEAEEALMQALKHNRHDYATWNLLGDLYSAMGRDSHAFAAMQRATELGNTEDSSVARSFMVMAKMLEASGKRNEAYRMYERAGKSKNLDSSDVATAKAKVNRILHQSAVQLQTAFRGFQARKRLRSVSTRVFQRNYGSRVPLRNFNADNLQRAGIYKSSFFTRT